MSTAAESVDVPELSDDERWSDAVEAATTRTVTWGTYEWTARFQYFSNGRAHLELEGPADPLCKREIVADLLQGDGLDPYAAAVLAEGWHIDAHAIAAELEGGA